MPTLPRIVRIAVYLFLLGTFFQLALAGSGSSATVFAQPDDPTAQVEPSLSLPLRANKLSDLAPSYLPQVTATLDESTRPNDFASDWQNVSSIDAQHESSRLASDGAAITFPQNQIMIIADRATVSGEVQIDVAQLPLPPFQEVSYKGGLASYNVSAYEAGSDQLITDVSKPFFVALDLRSLNREARTDWYIAYQDTNQSDLLRFAPVTIHDEMGLISAKVEVLSGTIIAGAFDLETSATQAALAATGIPIDQTPSPWRYSWLPPSVSEFSGAATYSYPIEVPPGRAGLQPNIDISYSSRGVDGHVISNGTDQGALGSGWSLNSIEIARGATDVAWDGAHYFIRHSDQFSLVINGQSHNLKRFAGEPVSNVNNYYAVNAPWLRVQQIYDSNVTNPDDLYWIVKSPEGITYRLGFTNDSETGQTVWPGSLLSTEGAQHGGTQGNYGSLRWRVDTVTDLFGNQIQYDYTKWDEPTETYQKSGSDGTLVTTSNARLTQIRFNYAGLAANPNTRLSGTFASKINFILSNHRVDAIELYHGNLSTPYRVIDIGLGQAGHNNLDCAHGEWDSVTYLVTYLRQQNGDGSAHLPDTTFSYVVKPHGTKEPATAHCYEFSYLETVQNGYGGKTKFSYLGDGRSGYHYEWVDTDGNGTLDKYKAVYPEYGQSYYVTKVENWDGRHNGVRLQQPMHLWRPATTSWMANWVILRTPVTALLAPASVVTIMVMAI